MNAIETPLLIKEAALRMFIKHGPLDRLQAVCTPDGFRVLAYIGDSIHTLANALSGIRTFESPAAVAEAVREMGAKGVDLHVGSVRAMLAASEVEEIPAWAVGMMSAWRPAAPSEATPPEILDKLEGAIENWSQRRE